MSSKPFFKLWFSDLVGDTLHLKDAEIGNYFLILGAIWNAGGEVDECDVHRISRAPAHAWRQRWPRIARFLAVEDGKVSHPKLTAELKNMHRLSHLRKEVSAQGVEAKRLKRLKAGQPNGSSKSNQTVNQPQPPLKGPKEGPLKRRGDRPRATEGRATIPAPVVRAVERHHGPDFVASYLTGATCDPVAMMIKAATKTASRALRREAADTLRGLGWAVEPG